MNRYLVSARKYRPSKFDEVIGQKDIVRILKNEIINDKVAHAYLFYGPRGTGKTSTARIFANVLNCENAVKNNGEQCGCCPFCENTKNSIPFFELDAASNNSVEDIRRISDEARTISIFSKYKVFIIDEIHMLSQAAFNAFLKTLEEPKNNVVFILATTEFHKVPSTVVSRCQIMHFKLIPEKIIITQLQKILDIEKIKYDDEALSLISRQAFGSMRDALSILDALIGSSSDYLSIEKVQNTLNILDKDKFFTLLEKLIKEDYENIFSLTNEILNNGFDGLYFLNGFLEFFMNIFYEKNGLQKTTSEKYESISKDISLNTLTQILELFDKTISNYRESLNKKLYIELFLIKLTNVLKGEN